MTISTEVQPTQIISEKQEHSENKNFSSIINKQAGYDLSNKDLTALYIQNPAPVIDQNSMNENATALLPLAIPAVVSGLEATTTAFGLSLAGGFIAKEVLTPHNQAKVPASSQKSGMQGDISFGETDVKNGIWDKLFGNGDEKNLKDTLSGIEKDLIENEYGISGKGMSLEEKKSAWEGEMKNILAEIKKESESNNSK